MSSERTVTTVEGHRLTLSNLDKVLYPETGFTKAEMISFYVEVAGALLPHLAGRPVTLRRYPDGVDGQSFFEKHVPRGAPRWVPTFAVPRSGRATAGDEDIVAVVVGDVATLVWAANLAAIELHVPMWRGEEPGRYGPTDLMVFDLDPGPATSVVECCQVAEWLRAPLEEEGLEPLPKTSGSKGLQLYVALRPARPWEEVRERAHDLARRTEKAHPELVVSTMRKSERPGRVLIDWSQNHPAKTTIAPYSLRARPHPTVSTPVTWEEVAGCRRRGRPEELVFEADQVRQRLAERGDLFESLVS